MVIHCIVLQCSNSTPLGNGFWHHPAAVTQWRVKHHSASASMLLQLQCPYLSSKHTSIYAALAIVPHRSTFSVRKSHRPAYNHQSLMLRSHCRSDQLNRPDGQISRPSSIYCLIGLVCDRYPTMHDLSRLLHDFNPTTNPISNLWSQHLGLHNPYTISILYSINSINSAYSVANPNRSCVWYKTAKCFWWDLVTQKH